jgi:hypothetical protein
MSDQLNRARAQPKLRLAAQADRGRRPGRCSRRRRPPPARVRRRRRRAPDRLRQGALQAPLDGGDGVPAGVGASRSTPSPRRRSSRPDAAADRAESQNVVSFKEVVDEDQTKADYYQTQYNILQSRALARKTLEALKLWEHPLFTREATASARRGRGAAAGRRLFTSAPARPRAGRRRDRVAVAGHRHVPACT